MLIGSKRTAPRSIPICGPPLGPPVDTAIGDSALRIAVGAALCCNLALRQARGAYIAFQNSDDIWRPGQTFGRGGLAANPGYGACFTAVNLCDEAGNPPRGSDVRFAQRRCV
jgi:hypothetical protein